VEARRRLPEGVGKKIVEALKQESVMVNEIPDEEYIANNDFSQDEFTMNPQAEYSDWDNHENLEYTGEDNAEFNEHADDSYEFMEDAPQNSEYTIQEEQPRPKRFVEMPKRQLERISINQAPQTDYTLSGNVDILRRLISQLPAGVTRQTGAQIIRQTMEAMGISMNSVLSEAQMVQENLGNSAKDCLNTIEEYKNNIQILERKVQNYKKQADQLGDLINLFILSDTKK